MTRAQPPLIWGSGFSYVYSRVRPQLHAPNEKKQKMRASKTTSLMFLYKKPGHTRPTGSQLPQVFLIIIMFILMSSVEGRSTEFRSLNSCLCPGYSATYECQVVGGGFTVWNGSAFDCSLTNDEIVLQHRNFNGGTMKSCNSGNIIGRSVSVTSDCYTSRLDVNITTQLSGKNVECVYQSGTSTTIIVIGSAVISPLKDPYPPPNDVWLVDANPGVLTFSWNPTLTDCSSLNYIIDSDCGDCPKTSSQANVSCTLNQLPIDSSCSFAVGSVVCGNIAGNWSSPIFATVKVPDAPDITSIVSTYGSDEKKKLINLDVMWNEVDSFDIFGGVSGSSYYYRVLFSNTLVEQLSTCAMVNVSASNCLNGVCTASLPSSCYKFEGNIAVSISATNRLGQGAESSTYIIDATNQYVDVSFESARRVVCRFLVTVPTESHKSCSINYGPCNQRLTMAADGSTASPTTIVIDLDTNLNTYCYSLNASLGTFVWLIEGSYGLASSESHDRASVVRTTVPSIVLSFVIIIMSIIIIVLCRLLKGKRRRNFPLIDFGNNRSDTASGSSKATHMARPSVEMKENLNADSVHVTVEFLNDCVYEVLKALEIFKDIDISIDGVMVYARSERARKSEIHVQCTKQLTADQKEKIEKTASDKSEKIQIEFGTCAKGTGHDKSDASNEYVYTRALSRQPRGLYSILDGIYKLLKFDNAYIWMSIIDIKYVCPSACTGKMVVKLKFLGKIPQNWKQTFNAIREDDQPMVKQHH